MLIREGSVRLRRFQNALHERGLNKAGTSFENVVMVHAFLRHMEDWPAYHEVYIEYFSEHTPPRYTVQAEMASPELLVEIHMTAAA